ncbi:MAG: LarC family nickel insertion protein, partial [Candidatus Tectomicrobia bacterium]|nr:LarC family nickel insertion protein [Candidatus Tectomicrobia bacterium]
MRTAYFDCFSGISGDMTIGALLDAGASFEELRVQLAGLNVPGYEVASEKVTKQGIAGTKFHVHVHDPGTQHRRLRDIEAILRGSGLASHVQDRALQVFTRLADAEASIHHTTIDQVH